MTEGEMREALTRAPRPVLDDGDAQHALPFERRYDDWWHEHVEPLLEEERAA